MSSYWHPALPNAAIARGVLKQYPATLKILLRPNHSWSQLKSAISLVTGLASVCDPSVAVQQRIQALLPWPLNAHPCSPVGHTFTYHHPSTRRSSTSSFVPFAIAMMRGLFDDGYVFRARKASGGI